MNHQELTDQVKERPSSVPGRKIGQAYSPTAIADVVAATSEVIVSMEKEQLHAIVDQGLAGTFLSDGSVLGDYCGLSTLQDIVRATHISIHSDRRDAKRYRWLLGVEPILITNIAYRYGVAVKFGNPSEAIDAAIAEDEAE